MPPKPLVSPKLHYLMQLGILIASNNATSATPVVVKSDMNRVAKCHGYDIRIWYLCKKNGKLGVKVWEEQLISKNKPFLGRFVQKVYKLSWIDPSTIVYPHLFITRNLVWSAKNVAIYALFSGVKSCLNILVHVKFCNSGH